MSDVLLYRTPRSAWLKASAAAVRSYDPIRADIWLWYADLVDRRAASGQDRHSTNGCDGSRQARSAAAGGGPGGRAD